MQKKDYKEFFYYPSENDINIWIKEIWDIALNSNYSVEKYPEADYKSTLSARCSNHNYFVLQVAFLFLFWKNKHRFFLFVSIQNLSYILGTKPVNKMIGFLECVCVSCMKYVVKRLVNL